MGGLISSLSPPLPTAPALPSSPIEKIRLSSLGSFTSKYGARRIVPRKSRKTPAATTTTTKTITTTKVVGKPKPKPKSQKPLRRPKSYGRILIPVTDLDMFPYIVPPPSPPTPPMPPMPLSPLPIVSRAKGSMEGGEWVSKEGGEWGNARGKIIREELDLKHN
jgi:hypothetical protein